MIVRVSATCGILRSLSSSTFIVSLVRDTEAPSGSCTTTKKTPWSSSGRKPVGVLSAAK